MSDYQQMVARERKWMFYLLAVFVIGAGFTPYLRIFLGLILGTMVSLYNMWILQKKMDDMSEAVARNEKPKGTGIIARFAAVAFATLIALRFDEYFHIIAVVIGLMTSIVVIMIDYLVYELKKKD